MNFLRKKNISNTIGMSNSLEPHLGPNCLPRLSADDPGRQRVKKVKEKHISIFHSEVVSSHMELIWTPSYPRAVISFIGVYNGACRCSCFIL